MRNEGDATESSRYDLISCLRAFTQADRGENSTNYRLV